jgi:hypothetical protein
MSRDLPRQENANSFRIREQLVHLFTEADECAGQLGIPVMARSFPAPAVGGPVIPVNLLWAAFAPEQGHSPLPERDVLDAINRCVATAIAKKRRLFWIQLINPVWWFVEVVAYVLRLPFLILRRAGVPAGVEEGIWGHIVKVLVFLAMVLIGIHYGLNLSAKDVLNWIK